jgi:hypothetical protein
MVVHPKRKSGGGSGSPTKKSTKGATATASIIPVKPIRRNPLSAPTRRSPRKQEINIKEITISSSEDEEEEVEKDIYSPSPVIPKITRHAKRTKRRAPPEIDLSLSPITVVRLG